MKNTKINIYDLYRNINEVKEKRNNSYNEVLQLIHERIKKASLKEQYKLVYDVPEYLFGVPSYNLNNCVAYLIKELRSNGFLVKYYFPKILYISWDPVEITNYKKEKKLIAKKFKNIQQNKMKIDDNKIDYINNDTNVSDYHQNHPDLSPSLNTQHTTSVFKPILNYDPNVIPTYNYYAYSTLNNNLTNDNFYITNQSNQKEMTREYIRTPEHLNNIKMLEDKRNIEIKQEETYQKDILDYYKEEEEIPFKNSIKKHNSNGKFILDLS